MERLGDPAPVPPAVTPSPTAEPAGTVLTCGLAIADLAVFDDAPVTIEALLDDAVVAPGEPLTTRVTVAAVHPPGGDVGEDSLTLLTFAAVQDGVVVGLGLGTVNPGSTQGLSGRSGVTALSTIDLATCGEDGEAVSPLDVGGYQLYAGLTASFAGSGGEQRMLLGGPWPFTITDQPPTAEPAGPPALEDLVISTSGLGPLRLGDPVPTAPGPTDIIRWDDQACAGTDVPGRWVPVYGQVPVFGGYTWYPFSVGVSADGAIVQLEVDATGPHTAEGIGVGSRLDELRAAYPDAELLVGEYSTDAWGLRSGGAVISFEVAARDDVEWSPEELDHVVRVHVLPADTTWFSNWGWGELCG